MFAKDRQFVSHLRNLASDYADSGMEATAEDLDNAATTIEHLADTVSRMVLQIAAQDREIKRLERLALSTLADLQAAQVEVASLTEANGALAEMAAEYRTALRALPAVIPS